MVTAFNVRCQEMDSLLHHLAAFLDPRYRTALIAKGELSKLIDQVNTIWLSVCTCENRSFLQSQWETSSSADH